VLDDAAPALAAAAPEIPPAAAAAASEPDPFENPLDKTPLVLLHGANFRDVPWEARPTSPPTGKHSYTIKYNGIPLTVRVREQMQEIIELIPYG
jgi:hypothetical protein